jgi:hypothetical protein
VGGRKGGPALGAGLASGAHGAPWSLAPHLSRAIALRRDAASGLSGVGPRLRWLPPPPPPPLPLASGGPAVMLPAGLGMCAMPLPGRMLLVAEPADNSIVLRLAAFQTS